jgi:dTMP kinase
MTRSEQPSGEAPHGPATDDALTVDSRERAVRALLRHAPLRRLWGAHFTSAVADALSVLVLLLLSLHAAAAPAAGQPVFGGGYRGVAFVVAAFFGARLLATLLFGAVLLGPVSALVGASGPLDRRWTMVGADGLRVVALVIAPLWIAWTPQKAFALLLVTVFVTGVAERFWTVAKDSAAPALLPEPPPEGAAVRPLPDHQEALSRLWLRTSFTALPIAAAALLLVTGVSNLLAIGLPWFDVHRAALAAYVSAGLFAASLSVVYFLELPATRTRRPRSPLQGLRRPRNPAGRADKGRTGAVPLLVFACAATAGAIAAAVALAALQAADLDLGPAGFALFVLVLTAGTAGGIRLAPHTLPVLSRRRLLPLAVAVAGLALLAAGLTSDPTTVVLLALLAGLAAGIAAHTGHTLIDQETEEARRSRTTDHLHAVVRTVLALSAVAAPVLAALIGPHRAEAAGFVFDHGGAAFTLMLVGALLLPVAALLLVRTDDRQGVPLRRDVREAFAGAEPAQAPAATGFFLAVEGGDGAGKTTQVEALADWIRAKGHEVVVTREPGATPIGKRLRTILLDVSSTGLSHRAEALLYAADRAEHVESVVRPALERGAVVISDRYIDSSVAYQGAGRDLSPTEIARISRWATDGLVPHLTVLLDVSPETARERFTEAPDRLESEPAEFHQRVRAGFLTLAAADPARYLVVDAGQQPESVTSVVRYRLDQMLPLSEAEVQAREEARRAVEEQARARAEEEAARKAEEERRERERQEELERRRAEEEERKRREIELERQREEARRAEEERARREAEEQAREEEQERLRLRAEEEARVRAEDAERRRQRQRESEEALLRAERARKAAAASPQKAPEDENEQTVRIPKVDPAEETTVLPKPGSEDETRAMPTVPAEQDENGGKGGNGGNERTREMPQAISLRKGEDEARPRRPRPDWAEETPLDDVPTLADELLGPREEHDDAWYDEERGDDRRR